MRAGAIALLIAAAALCSGCGTAVNTLWLDPYEDGQRVYGGVRVDLEVLQSAGKRESGISVSGETVPLSRLEQVKRVSWLAIDLPLSAIGDTLTLPYTLACQLSARRTLIRSFQSCNLDYQLLLAAEGEPIGTPTTPPPPIGLDRFPEVRHRVGSR